MKNQKTIIMLFIIALLPACAPNPTVDNPDEIIVRWVRMQPSEVRAKCGADAEACFRTTQGKHVIYTRKPTGPYDEQLHRALGHELRHGFEGYFHGTARRYVDLKSLGQ